jgi:hypothetical protein
MKTIKILVLTLLVLAMAVPAFAASSPFTVLAYHGKIDLMKKGNKKGEKLTKKNKIDKEDKIVLGSDSYLGLAHKSGLTLEITKAGTYTVVSLNKKIENKKKSGGLASKLTDLVVSELGEADDLLENNDYKLDMSTSGTVQRGIVISDNDENMGAVNSLDQEGYLVTKLPRKTNLLNSKITFYWASLPEASKYQFNIFDRFEEQIFEAEVGDTILTPDLSKLELDHDAYYIWNVVVANKPEIKTDDRIFMILSKDKEKAVLDDVKLIEDEYAMQYSPIGNMIMARYFESKELFLDAKVKYEKALVLSQNAISIQNMYSEFMMRMQKVK